MSRNSRAVDGFYNRLEEARREVERGERHLASAKRRRDLLCAKLLHQGESSREVGRVAGISGVAVLSAAKRARAASRRAGGPSQEAGG